jgi:hypothetical protein
MLATFARFSPMGCYEIETEAIIFHQGRQLHGVSLLGQLQSFASSEMVPRPELVLGFVSVHHQIKMPHSRTSIFGRRIPQPARVTTI